MGRNGSISQNGCAVTSYSPYGREISESAAMDAAAKPPQTLADNTAPKQRGRPFERGNSGNPRGRPKGARNRTTLAVEALLDGEAEGITRKAIEKALDG